MGAPLLKRRQHADAGDVCRTLSIKHVRRMIEQDLGLEKKSLDQQKDVVANLIDKVRSLLQGIGLCRVFIWWIQSSGYCG